MSSFDDPFDADRALSRSGCVCGQHRSAGEHDQAVLTLRCDPVPMETEQQRYEGVVASAVMRAMFPQDAARRAFLKSVGASTALAAISQFFPIKTATEVFAEAGAPEKKDLKVGFIPITCATPIIMAAAARLLCQAWSQRRSGQDRRLGGDPRQDHQQGIRRRAHAGADAARDFARARRAERSRSRCRRSRTSTARASRSR